MILNRIFVTQRLSSYFNNNYKQIQCLRQISSFSIPILGNQKTFPEQNKLVIQYFITCPQKSSFSTSTKDQNKDPQKQNDGDDDEDPLTPMLMQNIVPRGMPSIFYSFKNLYLVNFVLRPKIDPQFNIKDFIEGAKQAMLVVSSHLAHNRLDELEGLIDPEALKEIRTNYDRLTLAQRKDFELLPSDVVLAFAHHIDIQTLKEEFTGTKKYIVNLFMVFDCVRNLEETLRERASQASGGVLSSMSPQKSMAEMFRDFSERKIICNYEFRREYIEEDQNPHKGNSKTIVKAANDWIITKLLHIKEKDLLGQFK